MFTKKISQISTETTPIIEATIYTSNKISKEPIIYLHGGGLVFGQRDDLPEAYLTLLTDAGHPVITLDYLLAPEVKLPLILKTLKETLESVISQLPEWGFSSDYHLMGRSAGGYLAYLLAKEGFKPQNMILFYSYYTLEVPNFRQPSPAYLKFPRVAPMDLEALIESQPIVSGEMGKRYPIYLSGRQFGNWLPRLLPSLRDIPMYSLTGEDLQQLPPAILIHSTDDSDIPYDLSVNATKFIPQNQLVTIIGNEHDFDRQVSDETLAVYQQVIDFIG